MSEQVFSNIKVTPIKKDSGSVKASGTVTVANVLDVRFTVADGKNGLWVKLPQHTFEATNRETGKKETRFVKDVRILDEQLYQQFQTLVIEEYNKVASSASNGESRPSRDKKPF